jgi:putative inorganic carbon (HCO3(-)) transporter
MLRSLWLLVVYVSFIGLGTQAPFITALGYVWVDTFSPQAVAYIILNQIPVAMIMGASSFGLYLLLDRRSPPRLTVITLFQVALAVWCTLSMTWAVMPELGWEKWDWAFKTLMFSAFIPFVIRSRVQIEAFLQIYLFSLAANIVPFGGKVFLSGGGYGQQLGLSGGMNFGLGEGSTLAAVGVMAIPLAFYLRKHGQLLPTSRIFRLVYVGIAFACLLATIGTYERTGLVGLVMLGGAMVFKSKNKLLVGSMALVVALGVFYFSSSGWNARVSTIGSYQEDGSAMTRLLVWRWTLGYVLEHPLGGGFYMFLINVIEHPADAGNPVAYVEHGRAFHSIYFEVLGEQGWVGLFLFVGMLVWAQVMLQRVSHRVRNIPELEWCRALAATLQVCLAVMSVCGMFIGIAFQPMIHYLLAATVSVSEYARRSTVSTEAPTGWRGASIAAPAWRGRRPAITTREIGSA